MRRLLLVFIAFFSANLLLAGDPTSQVHAVRSNTNPTAADSSQYRLVVSFFSKASGIDKKAQEEFEKYINNHCPKTGFEKTRWGREGEVDYCLKLAELSKRKQRKFVKNAKKLLKNSVLVLIRENCPCVHKR